MMGTSPSLLYTPESFSILLWALTGVLTLFGGFLTWFAIQMHSQINSLPAHIAKEVDALHATIKEDLSAMRIDLGAMRESQQQLERDIRSDFAHLDRRVTRLEVIGGVDITSPRRRDANEY